MMMSATDGDDDDAQLNGGDAELETATVGASIHVQELVRRATDARWQGSSDRQRRETLLCRQSETWWR